MQSQLLVTIWLAFVMTVWKIQALYPGGRQSPVDGRGLYPANDAGAGSGLHQLRGRHHHAIRWDGNPLGGLQRGRFTGLDPRAVWRAIHQRWEGGPGEPCYRQRTAGRPLDVDSCLRLCAGAETDGCVGPRRCGVSPRLLLWCAGADAMAVRSHAKYRRSLHGTPLGRVGLGHVYGKWYIRIQLMFFNNNVLWWGLIGDGIL